MEFTQKNPQRHGDQEQHLLEMKTQGKDGVSGI